MGLWTPKPRRATVILIAGMKELARFETAHFPLPGDEVRFNDTTWVVLHRRLVYNPDEDECWALITQLDALNIDKFR